MSESAIATAADYADAMITARRAKNVMVLILLLLLLAQLAFFFIVRYTDVLNGVSGASTATSKPAWTPPDVLNFVTNGCMFVSLIVCIVLGFVVLLIVNIMLVGRLIGVARLTSAYIWCLILLVLLFPWQHFLNNTGLTIDQAQWKLPGVLYTWSELKLNANFVNELSRAAVLNWARFVGFPLLAVIILLAIQIKSNRGMRQALGEEDVAA